MEKKVVGRQAFLENARSCCIIIGAQEREAIAKHRGMASISAYVRTTIMDASQGQTEIQKERDSLRASGKEKDAIIQEQVKELETLKNLVGKSEKVSKAKWEEVDKMYAKWISVNREGKDRFAHRSYFDSIGSKLHIKPEEIESHLFPEGLLEGLGEYQ